MNTNPRARIPELGERVQMGKYATAFRGVWGQVVKIDTNPPVGSVLGQSRRREGIIVPGATGGVDHTELHILTNLTHNGKRVMIKASPYEIEGAALDEAPIMSRG